MRTFILCVGAQKSGTTWLFKQIIKSKHFSRGLSKEYHLFDALYLGGCSDAVNNISRRINNYPFNQSLGIMEKNKEIMLSFYTDKNNYYDYIDSILTTNDSFTSDITPSYSGLKSTVLAEIKYELNKRGIAVKVIFLMREPITRLESALRMGLKRSKSLQRTESSVMAQKMRRMINSPDDMLRSNYAYTCGQIDQAFTANEVFYGFYETLFSQSETARLGAFLNLNADIFDANHIVNSSAKPFKYCLSDMNHFKELVNDRYQFVTERFNFDISKWDEATLKLVDHSL
tara:strand:+ start:3206 stop:4066 length:861 start_codon:yes stop_codon:yes gene_type:complete